MSTSQKQTNPTPTTYRQALDQADRRAALGCRLGLMIFGVFWGSLAIGQMLPGTVNGLPVWFLLCIGSSFLATVGAVLYWIKEGKHYQTNLAITSHDESTL